MNEGQRRYAMEQYYLALVRRGHRFEDVPSLLHSDEAQEYIDDFDLDLLGGASSSQEGEQAPTSSQEDRAAESFIDQLRERYGEMDRGAPAEVSSSQAISGSRKRGPDSIGGRPAKKASSHSPSALPGTSGNTDGMDPGAGEPAEAGLQPVEKIYRGITVHKHIFTYHKKWKFLSFGVADVILNDVNAATNRNRWALTSSLVNIPWEYAFFYMSPAEWARAREYKGFFAKHCSIKISQYNPRVAFQTADTTSTTATLNQNKFTRVGIGLRSNAALCCSDRDYVFDTNETMKPVNFEGITHAKSRQDLKECMYGLPNNSPEAAMQLRIPAYATGQELGLQRYLTFYAPKDLNVGFAPYDMFCEEYNSMDCIGKCIVDESYSFEYAPLQPKYPGVLTQGMLDTVVKSSGAPCGTKIEQIRSRSFPVDNTNPGPSENQVSMAYLQSNNSSNTNVDVSTFNDTKMYYEYTMEQAGIYEEMNRHTVDMAQQPSIHVGVRCVPKLSTNANLIQTNSWLDTQMYWIVDATLHCEAADPYGYILGGPRSLHTQQQACMLDNSTPPVPLVYNNDKPYSYGRRRVIKNNTAD